MVRWLWGWLVVVLCLLSSGVMAAEGEAPPQEQIKADPLAMWRIMGRTDQESSSDCIGQTDSLSCTIDTMMACFERADLHYCHQAIQNFPDIKFHWDNGVAPFSPTVYRIDGVRQVQKPEPIEPPSPLALQLSPLQAEPGDWVIELYRQNPYNPPFIIVLRQTDQQWRVVTWFYLYDESYGTYEDPDPTHDNPWKHMTAWSELSSSTCIGKADTPVCAMETLMACDARGGGVKCFPWEETKKSMMNSPVLQIDEKKFPFVSVNYKILSVEMKQKSKPSPDALGYYYLITTYELECHIFYNTCSADSFGNQPTRYFVHYDGNEWYVGIYKTSFKH